MLGWLYSGYTGLNTILQLISPIPFFFFPHGYRKLKIAHEAHTISVGQWLSWAENCVGNKEWWKWLSALQVPQGVKKYMPQTSWTQIAKLHRKRVWESPGEPQEYLRKHKSCRGRLLPQLSWSQKMRTAGHSFSSYKFLFLKKTLFPHHSSSLSLKRIS